MGCPSYAQPIIGECPVGVCSIHGEGSYTVGILDSILSPR